MSPQSDFSAQDVWKGVRSGGGGKREDEHKNWWHFKKRNAQKEGNMGALPPVEGWVGRTANKKERTHTHTFHYEPTHTLHYEPTHTFHYSMQKDTQKCGKYIHPTKKGDFPCTFVYCHTRLQGNETFKHPDPTSSSQAPSHIQKIWMHSEADGERPGRQEKTPFAEREEISATKLCPPKQRAPLCVNKAPQSDHSIVCAGQDSTDLLQWQCIDFLGTCHDSHECREHAHTRPWEVALEPQNMSGTSKKVCQHRACGPGPRATSSHRAM